MMVYFPKAIDASAVEVELTKKPLLCCKEQSGCTVANIRPCPKRSPVLECNLTAILVKLDTVGPSVWILHRFEVVKAEAEIS